MECQVIEIFSSIPITMSIRKGKTIEQKNKKPMYCPFTNNT